MTDRAPWPWVQGRCPACQATSLFVGSGGYITCARIDCPTPDAASSLLERDHKAAAARHAHLLAGQCTDRHDTHQQHHTEPVAGCPYKGCHPNA
ncbi:hypothetical protein [Streptomyces sp. NPDC086838]|uniref:hypothetical protein n=1 Tax=Streptomyces sp. NPDC086838 TaxID=3365762 RepID=UPI0037F9A852